MPMYGVPQGLTNPPRPLQETDLQRGEGDESASLTAAPGTIILVSVFLLAFVTYYFVNWKVLSFLWQIG
jgi:hypothetical protein